MASVKDGFKGLSQEFFVMPPDELLLDDQRKGEKHLGVNEGGNWGIGGIITGEQF